MKCRTFEENNATRVSYYQYEEEDIINKCDSPGDDEYEDSDLKEVC